MNLPENLSATAKKVYELFSTDQSPKTLQTLSTALMPQPAGEEGYKAVATADSLVVKGVVTVEKATDDTQGDFYTLVKGPGDVGPSEEADANEEYAEKTDTNEEEKRMMAIFEKQGARLPAKELFALYLQGQAPNSGDANATQDDLKTALQELTDAGLITAEGDTFKKKD